ncbi:spike base protein, RCAP_Rcc01079 family [Sphingomonas sp.]|uniref:spike base protein, RCAP_Rcc01079 family n=1 Tax=Sphingomonas sp. TaxID=28214 RepID=UPI002DD6A451|nr:hypothetical protein [Sphingomonas sp.]
MADQFLSFADQPSAPATRCVAVTPHDSNALTDIPKALYVGTGGSITMRGTGDGGDRIWAGIASGSVIPFRASHIRATGTTASNILALY